MSFYDRDYYSDDQMFSQPKPKATYGILIALGVGMLFYLSFLRASPATINQFLLYPYEVIKNFKIWQLLTYGLFHDLRSPFHLIINALMFWWIGKSVNLIMGNKRYLILIITSVFIGGLFYCVWAMTGISGGPEIPAMGASAGVYGMLGYFCTRFANNPITLIIPPVSFKAKWLLIIFMGIDIVFSFVPGGTGTAHMAHIGGAVVGILWVLMITKKGSEDFNSGYGSSQFTTHSEPKKGYFERLKEKKEEQKKQKEILREKEVKDHVDSLLDKIKESGINSLTEKEREFLRKSSENYKK